jgi:hypothetical protein
MQESLLQKYGLKELGTPPFAVDAATYRDSAGNLLATKCMEAIDNSLCRRHLMQSLV